MNRGKSALAWVMLWAVAACTPQTRGAENIWQVPAEAVEVCVNWVVKALISTQVGNTFQNEYFDLPGRTRSCSDNGGSDDDRSISTPDPEEDTPENTEEDTESTDEDTPEDTWPEDTWPEDTF